MGRPHERIVDDYAQQPARSDCCFQDKMRNRHNLKIPYSRYKSNKN